MSKNNKNNEKLILSKKRISLKTPCEINVLSKSVKKLIDDGLHPVDALRQTGVSIDDIKVHRLKEIAYDVLQYDGAATDFGGLGSSFELKNLIKSKVNVINKYEPPEKSHKKPEISAIVKYEPLIIPNKSKSLKEEIRGKKDTIIDFDLSDIENNPIKDNKLNSNIVLKEGDLISFNLKGFLDFTVEIKKCFIDGNLKYSYSIINAVSIKDINGVSVKKKILNMKCYVNTEININGLLIVFDMSLLKSIKFKILGYSIIEKKDVNGNRFDIFKIKTITLLKNYLVKFGIQK